jgi:hypothetical protein
MEGVPGEIGGLQMRRASWVAGIAAAAAFAVWGARTANASITGCNVANDGDGAINCTQTWAWSNADDAWVMAITGDQFSAPGVMVGTITTNSPSDPTLIVTNAIDNDTSFAWTAFEADVAMSSTFSLSSEAVTAPAGWSVSSATAPMLDTNPLDPDYNMYVGRIYMTGTPSIPYGGELDFQFTMGFTGFPSYNFRETLTPVPEPASAGVLALGGIGLMARRHRKS